ncbi:hypothetical protein BGX20_000908 [Mortierella sp. AD010]|nr:hypothetical protein BGX20_000908 [Mortierella sp. AD010]
MNVLVNYSSDSDSEGENVNPPTTHRQPISQQQQQDNENVKEVDDDFVSAALKDLQDFAAAVEEESSMGYSVPSNPSEEQIGVSDDPDDLGLQSFLKEIESIPCPPEEQGREQEQPPPPPMSPIVSSAIDPPPPPPPPPPPLDSKTLLPLHHGGGDMKELTSREIQMVQNRLYNLSLLPSSPIDQKDLERRLLEFAIRIVDWEGGGLYESYFLGRERAEAINNHKHITDEITPTEPTELPSFGGIVGSMIKHMFDLEQTVAPPGWTATWDAEDEAYGFQHLRTGTYSPVFPSQELICYLDPPSSQPSSSPVLPRNNRSYFTSRSATHVPGGPSPSISTALSAVSDSNSQLNAPPSPETSKSTSMKTKKRKADATTTDPAAAENKSFIDPHIHPSRRAALTIKSGTISPSVSPLSTTGSSSKAMPKKVASLLQRWSEKDLGDENNVNDNDHEEQENNRSDPHIASAFITGSNAQSLGGDWRDRRLHPR